MEIEQEADYKEIRIKGIPGFGFLWLAFALFILSILGFVAGGIVHPAFFGLAVILLVAMMIIFSGMIVINPNYACVCQFCGKYVGTVRNAGYWWVNPWYSKRYISLRINNFETNRIKVNDFNGSPIEIQAVVVWRILETAEACFEVENYFDYLRI
jgi:regulator of protease activity HflC (stomatin/prohibitin superfamily)